MKGDDSGRKMLGAGGLHHIPDDELMPQVDTVKCAYGNQGGMLNIRRLNGMEDVHLGRDPFAGERKYFFGLPYSRFATGSEDRQQFAALIESLQQSGRLLR